MHIIKDEKWRPVSQLAFLGLTIFLLSNNSLQRWLLVFAAGGLLSLLLGRVFCGWACPMGTLFRGLNFIYSRLGIQRRQVSDSQYLHYLKWLFLALFILTAAVTRALHIKVNFLLYLILGALLLTLFYEEKLWHKYLCPFGTILSFTSRPALFAMEIRQEDCTKCGLCARECPAGAVQKPTPGTPNYSIDGRQCLVCRECTTSCPSRAISYHRKDSKAKLNLTGGA
ncbi:MAG: 4Fe-4S binding protein [Halanaerobium sp.]|nr:4Fe-4S binding protein [Halanaerobium sp.]